MSKNNASERKLWRIVTDHPDIFDTHVVTKLNGNDVKFFYDVNTESRAAGNGRARVCLMPSRLRVSHEVDFIMGS